MIVAFAAVAASALLSHDALPRLAEAAPAARRQVPVPKWQPARKLPRLSHRLLEDVPSPLRIRDGQIEPIAWSDIDGWSKDDPSAAFATFLASCRPIARAPVPPQETRAMYTALRSVCARALRAGPLKGEATRAFFEDNFRPVRIAKLGESDGFLTGYYEPIVDGSRFPTGIFHVPIYRRPPDLVPPGGGPVGAAGFPNTGQSMRRTADGTLVPYYDRAAIEDGALDGRHLEICWIKDPTDALFIQIQGSARIRLEDGVMLRINYDSHNGYPYTPVGRILIDRKLVPRDEMSMERIRDWIRDNPEGAKELRRQNRSFVFFRVVGLSDDHEPAGAQGLPLTPGRSIAVDKGLHVYGTPFFIEGTLPIDGEKAATPFHRLMIAQDTGSAIVGPARADIYFGAGEKPGRVAGRVRHPGKFVMLVPRELDPVAAGARMPLPLPKPPLPVAETPEPKGGKAKAKPRYRAEDPAKINPKP